MSKQDDWRYSFTVDRIEGIWARLEFYTPELGAVPLDWPLGAEREWEVLMAEHTTVFGPPQRAISMLATRAGEEFVDAERALVASGLLKVSSKDRVRFSGTTRDFDRILRDFGGLDYYCGPRSADDAPWKVVKVPRGLGEAA